MSALRTYISDRQTAALKLANVIEAIDLLNHDNLAPNAVMTLIDIARVMANELENDLDTVTARGEKRLPSEQNQAILKSSGRPLGECRFKAVAEAQAAVDHDRRTLEGERRMVEEKIGRQFDRVEAMTLAARQDRQLAATARREAESDAKAVKALRMRLALLVGRMVRWLRRDDLTPNTKETGSELIVQASEMASGIDDGGADLGFN